MHTALERTWNGETLSWQHLGMGCGIMVLWCLMPDDAFTRRHGCVLHIRGVANMIVPSDVALRRVVTSISSISRGRRSRVRQARLCGVFSILYSLFSILYSRFYAKHSGLQISFCEARVCPHAVVSLPWFYLASRSDEGDGWMDRSDDPLTRGHNIIQLCASTRVTPLTSPYQSSHATTSRFTTTRPNHGFLNFFCFAFLTRPLIYDTR